MYEEKGEVFTISSEAIHFYKGQNLLVAMRENYDEDDEDTYEVNEINKDLFGLLYTYWKRNRDNLPFRAKLIYHPDDIDSDLEWDAWIPDTPEKKAPRNKRKPSSKPSPTNSPRKKKGKK